MPYDTVLPNRYSLSQPLLLNNFMTIKADFDISHVTFDTVVQAGKHAQVLLRPLGDDEAPVPVANEVILYNKIVDAPAPAQVAYKLYQKRVLLAGETGYPGYLDQDINSGGTHDINWTTTTSNVLIKWGTNNSGAILFPGPVFGAVPTFIGCLTNQTWSYSALTALGVTVVTPQPLRWLAIGVV